MDELTHLDDHGHARMVAVSGKPHTERMARAACEVHVSPETARLILGGDLPKGDVTGVARIAGIQAAKRTHELIPLCHQIALTGVDVHVEVDPGGVVSLTAEAYATDRTGVEMEALVAVTTAALTIYDMVKAVERGARVTDVRLLEKRGGTRGDWRADAAT